MGCDHPLGQFKVVGDGKCCKGRKIGFDRGLVPTVVSAFADTVDVDYVTDVCADIEALEDVALMFVNLGPYMPYTTRWCLTRDPILLGKLREWLWAGGRLWLGVSPYLNETNAVLSSLGANARVGSINMGGDGYSCHHESRVNVVAPVCNGVGGDLRLACDGYMLFWATGHSDVRFTGVQPGVVALSWTTLLSGLLAYPLVAENVGDGWLLCSVSNLFHSDDGCDEESQDRLKIIIRNSRSVEVLA